MKLIQTITVDPYIPDGGYWWGCIERHTGKLLATFYDKDDALDFVNKQPATRQPHPVRLEWLP